MTIVLVIDPLLRRESENQARFYWSVALTTPVETGRFGAKQAGVGKSFKTGKLPGRVKNVLKDFEKVATENTFSSFYIPEKLYFFSVRHCVYSKNEITLYLF